MKVLCLAAILIQSIAVTGRVVDAVSGRPVAGVQVTIGSRATVTDVEGRFHVDMSPGHWEIVVNALDYLPRTIPIDVVDSQGVAPLEIQLVPRKGFEEHLEVTAPEPPPVGPASLPLSPKRVLSTAGSLDNPFRTLQTLPGVAGTDEFGSKLSVRGGAPDQNLTLMEAMERNKIVEILKETHGNKLETAKRLGIGRQTLYNKIKAYAIAACW